jgi:hypothetical protein
MTTTPEQIDVLPLMNLYPSLAFKGLTFYLRDNPVKTSLKTIIQIKSEYCLFKRLPFRASFSGGRQ